MGIVSSLLSTYDQYLEGDIPQTDLVEKWSSLTPAQQDLVYLRIEHDSRYRIEVFELHTFVDDGTSIDSDSSDELLNLSPFEIKELPILGHTGYFLFVEGRNHIISAGPKVGKTQVILHCILHWAKERTVHVFSEESKELWAGRLQRIKNQKLEIYQFHICTDASYKMRHVILKARRMKEGDILVVDTLRRYARYKDENDSMSVQRAMQPLIDAAKERGITLIVLHHSSKVAADGGRKSAASAGAGSNALSGIFDACLQLLRVGDGFTLSGSVRDCESKTASMHWNKDLLMMGKSNVPATSKGGDITGEIEAVLTSDWKTPSEISELLPHLKPGSVKTLLGQMIAIGKAQRLHTNGRGKVQKYRTVSDKVG